VPDTTPPTVRWWSAATSGGRLTLAVTVGLVVGVVTTVAATARFGPMFGWDAAAATFLLATWLSIAHLDGTSTRALATREDPSTRISELILLAASLASLVSVGLVLSAGMQGRGSTEFVSVLLGVASVALSWAVVHTVYCLRYARMFYAPPEGGIDFNEPTNPTYVDFAYLAFTVGMTFQVSDTNITAREVRGAVLRHSLVSFLFTTVIISVTVNLVAGLGH
jgi:uncharacterized membrane protein